MKKILFLLFIIMVCLLIKICYSMELETKLLNKTIVIDSGHGGKDGGSVVDDVLEKNINLQIALKLKEKLIKSGANVIMTRDGDFDLSSPNANRRKKSDFDNRVSLINNAGADLYISIHLNYLSDSRYSGAQVFYTKGNEYLAEIMQESLASYLKTKMPAKKLSDTIYMYKKLKVPGILIECGFLSNENERNLLISEKYQEQIALAIIKGIISYY